MPCAGLAWLTMRGQRDPDVDEQDQPACPVPPEARPRLRGARPGTAQPPRLPEPLVITRRVSARGSVMVGGQRIHVGLANLNAHIVGPIEVVAEYHRD
jgi:hypothetical protein